jgi:hypothetical protein
MPSQSKRSCPVLRIPQPGDPRTLDCPIYSCGNAARVHGSYIDALDTSGEPRTSPQSRSYRIARGSLTHAGGGCRGLSGLSLEVRDSGFVGVTAGTRSDATAKPSRDPVEVRCSGDDLRGAQFQLEHSSSGRTLTIEIAGMKKVATWRPDRPEEIPAYDMVIREARSGRAAPQVEHLCPGSDHEPDQYAVLIQGETYDRDGAVANTGSSWFNIGCAGSALSKLRLLGLDPSNGASTVEERQATLKMVTGQYCKGWTGTRDGTFIYPVPASGRGGLRALRPGAGLAPERIGPIESRWGASGALCVSHLRLWSPNDTCAQYQEHETVEQIQRICGIPACDETRSCDAEDTSTDGTTIWRTCTVDHVQSHARPQKPATPPAQGGKASSRQR